MRPQNENEHIKVFLGGTCAGSDWRDRIIPLLGIDYVNPVTSNRTMENRAEEIRQRETCDLLLYTITGEMRGYYSIAEAVEDANLYPQKMVFCLLLERFDIHQVKSLEEVADLIRRHGVPVVYSLEAAANEVNSLAARMQATHQMIREKLGLTPSPAH